MIRFSLLDLEAVPWDQVESCVDHLVFKSKAWFDFLGETQKLKPVILSVAKDDKIIGFFVGAGIRKGVRIVAGPFEGWTTPFQGLTFLEPISAQERIAIYGQLSKYCLQTIGCSFFQATDWHLTPEDMVGSGQSFHSVRGYRLDLTQDEEALFSGFSSACRRAIRKAQKSGVRVQESENIDQFITNYYDQLCEVFQKKGNKPTYSRSRVEALVRHLYGTGNLLLLESRSPDGNCIGTGIFPATKNLMQFWGGASFRSHLILRPNEILFWEAIRYWKKRGVLEFELGGRGAYKEKYGPEPYVRVQIIATRWPFLAVLKSLARKVYYGVRHWRGQGILEAGRQLLVPLKEDRGDGAEND